MKLIDTLERELVRSAEHQKDGVFMLLPKCLIVYYSEHLIKSASVLVGWPGIAQILTE